MWTLRETSSGVSSGDLWGRDPCGTLTSASLSFTSSSRGRKTIPCKEMNLVRLLNFTISGWTFPSETGSGLLPWGGTSPRSWTTSCSVEAPMSPGYSLPSERYSQSSSPRWPTFTDHRNVVFNFFFLVTNIKLRNILAIFIYIEPSHKTLLYFSPVRALDNKTFTYKTDFFYFPINNRGSYWYQ